MTSKQIAEKLMTMVKADERGIFYKMSFAESVAVEREMQKIAEAVGIKISVWYIRRGLNVRAI